MAFISLESSLQKPILIWFDDISIYACWYINVVVGIWCDLSSMLINSNQQLVNIILEERFEKYVIKLVAQIQLPCHTQAFTLQDKSIATNSTYTRPKGVPFCATRLVTRLKQTRLGVYILPKKVCFEQWTNRSMGYFRCSGAMQGVIMLEDFYSTFKWWLLFLCRTKCLAHHTKYQSQKSWILQPL